MMTDTTTEQKIASMDAGHDVDFALSNGIIRSSKTAYAYYDGVEGQPLKPNEKPTGYAVHHDIDGTVTYFTRQGIAEVFDGKRSPWEGDNE